MFKCKIISYTLSLVVLISLSGLAQIKQIDSLLQLVSSRAELDTLRVQNLYRLSFLYKELDPRKSLQFGNEALVLSRTLNYKKGEAAALNNIGATYDYIGKTKEAIHYLFQSYELKKAIQDYRGLVSSLNNLGVIYKREGNYKNAIFYYNQSKIYAQKANHTLGLLSVEINLGILYKELHNEDSAKYYLVKSIPAAKNNVTFINDIYTALAELYEYSPSPRLAIQYADTGLIYLSKSKSKKPFNFFYMIKATAYAYMAQNDSAKLYYEKARLEAKDSQNYNHINQLYDRMAQFYDKYYSSTQQVHYLSLAYGYEKIASAARTKIYEQNNAKLVNSISQQMEVDELEKEVAATVKEKELADLQATRRGTILIFSIVLLFITLFLAVLLYKRYVMKQRLNLELEQKLVLQKQEQKNQLQMAQFENEIRVLRMQINPHFLFNSLNNIYSYAVQKKEETPELILLLSDILRFLSEKMDETSGSSLKEVSITKKLIELYQINKRWQGKIQCNIDPLLFTEDFKMEPHSILTLVENAFKHTNLDEADGTIHIKMTFNKGIEVRITNKVSVVKTHASSGIGLKNLAKRLQMTYGNLYAYTFNLQHGFYEVYLFLPKL